jgi:hypothetical protein
MSDQEIMPTLKEMLDVLLEEDYWIDFKDGAWEVWDGNDFDGFRVRCPNKLGAVYEAYKHIQNLGE